METGSKVKFRGVDIGKVHAIDFTRSRYEQAKRDGTRKPYVLIDVAVDERVLETMGTTSLESFLKAEVERGLRFRLNAQGITGLSYLELDYVDPGERRCWRSLGGRRISTSRRRPGRS